MTKVHSKVGASSAYRWFTCPGSVRLLETVPAGKTSIYAEEGTAAHELAEKCLYENKDAADFLGEFFNAYGDTPGFEVTDEMAEAVQVYLDTIRNDLKALEGAELHIEEPFHLNQLHEALHGTNDACITQPFGILRVYDYKHGKGIAVEVEDNKQLKYYALGAAFRYDFMFDEIEIVIVQPRAPHKDGAVRRWRTSTAELRAWAGELVEAVRATEKPDAALVAGDHCRFCAAAGACPALRGRVNEIAKAKFAPVTNTITLPTPADLSPDEIRDILDSAGIFDHWIREVQSFALEMAMKGTLPTGYKLVQKRTHRRWINEDTVVEKMKPILGDKIFSQPKLLSPAQIEKLAGKAHVDTVKTLWTQPQGEMTLASEKDSRPAVAIRSADQVFSAIPAE